MAPRRRRAPQLVALAAAALLVASAYFGRGAAFANLARLPPTSRVALCAQAEQAVRVGPTDFEEKCTDRKYAGKEAKLFRYCHKVKGKFVPMGPKPWDKDTIYSVTVSYKLMRDERKSRSHLAQVFDEIRRITGNVPCPLFARYDDQVMGLRKKDCIGAKSTLRKYKKEYFLDRLNKLVLPRIRDFEGLNPKSFDNSGGYSLRVPDQDAFRELDAILPDRLFQHGFDIAIRTNAREQPHAYRILRDKYGFPFADWDSDTFPKRNPEKVAQYKEWHRIKKTAINQKKNKKRSLTYLPQWVKHRRHLEAWDEKKAEIRKINAMNYDGLTAHEWKPTPWYRGGMRPRGVPAVKSKVGR